MNKKQLEILCSYNQVLTRRLEESINPYVRCAYGYASFEFCRAYNDLVSAADDSQADSDPQLEARVANIEREIHNSLKKTAELHGKELQEQLSCTHSEFESAIADVRDECEKLRSNERQITEYVNKIRADLDAITTDKTCVVVLGQCVSELRNTLTNAQLAGQLEVNKINERLAKLENYCHAHCVDSTGACCPGEPVVGVKPVKVEEATTPVRVNDGDKHIDAAWLLSCGFIPRKTSSPCQVYYESPLYHTGKFFNIWMESPCSGEWETSWMDYTSDRRLRHPVNRRDVRARAAHEGCPFVEPDPSTTSP